MTRSIRRRTACRSGSPGWVRAAATTPRISSVLRLNPAPRARRPWWPGPSPRDMPIGPMRLPLRNCLTTGSSLVSSTSRGPNMTSSRRNSMPMLSGTVRATLMLCVTIRIVASICAFRSIEQLGDVGGAHRVEPGVRLVDEDDLRVEHQRPGQARALAHAAGDLAGELALRAGQADHVHLLDRRCGGSPARTSSCAHAAGMRRCRRGSSSRTARRPGTARRTASECRTVCAPNSPPGRYR